MSHVFTATLTPKTLAGFVFACCVFLIPNIVQAGTTNSVTLQWSPNPEPHLAGYKIYHGTKSGIYGDSQKVGNTTTYQYTNLVSNTTHYFTLTAYDALGNESPPSQEVSTTITETDSVLSIPLNGNGTVQSSPVGVSCSGSSCEGTFSPDTSVTLTAVPKSGYTFSGWTGPCTGNGACFLTLSQSATVTANFSTTSSTGGSEGTPVKTWSAVDQIPGGNWTDSTWDNRSFRNLLEGTSITTNGSIVQLTLRGRSSDSYTIQRVSLVQREGNTLNGDDATFRQVTFGGTWDAGVTVPAGGLVTSDPVAFDLKAGQDVFVTFWVPSGNPTVYRDGASSTTTWVIQNTDHSSTIDWGNLAITATRPYVYIAERLEVTNKQPQPTPPSGAGTSDLLWRNPSTGMLALWVMDGLNIQSVEFPGSYPMEWNIEQVGDVNGDGKTDLLWQNKINGLVALWLMNEESIVSQVILGRVSAEWVIAGMGDVNNDGKADVVWRHSSTGTVGMWLMNGVRVASVVTVGFAPSEWEIVYLGDVNSDGKADVVWRHSSTGAVGMWLMNGAKIASVVSPGVVPLEWEIVRLGDVNGDGNKDLVWRLATSGEVAIWLMNGAAIVSLKSLGTVPLEWEIAQVGDVNGDGKDDVIWHNTINGQVVGWLMDGLTISSVELIGSASTDWKIQD